MMKPWTLSQARRIFRYSILTGIPQIIGVKGMKRKVIKSAVFLFCLLGFFYQTSQFLKVYWTYPTVVYIIGGVQPTIYEPAITVCSHNGVDGRKFCEIFPEYCSPPLDFLQFCKRQPSNCNRRLEKPNEPTPAVSIHELPKVNRSVYRSLGVQADEIFEKCTMYDNGIKMDCALNFLWIPVFDLRGLPSNCYAINSLWGNVTMTRKKIGRKTVFILMLKGFEEHLFYERIPLAYQVMVHNSYALVNPFVGGFTASRCYDYFVYISMVNKILQPFPYSTNCTDYTTLWYEREGKNPLNQNMCTEECILNVSLATDNCVNPYNSVYPTEAMACRGTLHYDEVYEKCHKEHCNPACKDEKFRMDVQEVKHALGDTADVKTCSTKIVISFERMEEIRFEYIPKYESIELFSYVGGYLGVWLGISLIAVFDFVECLVVLISMCALKCGKVNQRKRVFTAPSKYDNHFGRVFGKVGSVTIY